MRISRITVVVGGLLLGATGAMAQQLAEATPAPTREVVVFADKGSHALSPTARETVNMAATQASSAPQVTLTGRPENVAQVRSAMVADGVPAQSIVTQPEMAAPLPKVSDGLSNTSDQRVEIKY